MLRILRWRQASISAKFYLLAVRAHAVRPQSARAALALGSLALLAPSYAAAADNEDVAELRRMLRELQTQNRQLSRRLSALESAREAPAAPRTKPARAQQRRTPAPTAAAPPVVASPPVAQPLPEPRDTTKLGLWERVKELEIGWAAQENATRQIIRDALSKTGPKINSYLALSGVIEVVGSRSRDFNGPTKDTLALSTTELDFDIKLSDWLTGSVVLNWDSGTSTTFPTTPIVIAPGVPTAVVDRFTLDRTHISIGDFTQFPIAARLGREVLHFGTSTGVARLDTLSIGTPLTTEVFENRQTAAGLEFAWPTPPLGPLPPPVIVPPVRPLFLAPLVGKIARWLGYRPLPQRAIRPVPVRPPLIPPPFYGSFLVYRGSDNIVPNRRIGDFNASLGYRTNGHCGVPYEELRSSLVCPWQIDVHVDFNTSVFDSKFLESSYRPFLNQIGAVPGVAASAKASFGPFALVGEVNKAIESVTFFDGLGILRTFTPMTWQFSVGYQFDWNPWVLEIGHQGNFISVGYSGSSDMAGVTDLINGVPIRVGFVPQNRLFVTAGEWVMDGLKVAVEYSANWDYPVSSGGTGQLAHGVFGSVQLNF
jgi:uncharacterized coiled-coil protein SlyX